MSRTCNAAALPSGRGTRRLEIAGHRPLKDQCGEKTVPPPKVPKIAFPAASHTTHYAAKRRKEKQTDIRQMR